MRGLRKRFKNTGGTQWKVNVCVHCIIVHVFLCILPLKWFHSIINHHFIDNFGSREKKVNFFFSCNVTRALDSPHPRLSWVIGYKHKFIFVYRRGSHPFSGFPKLFNRIFGKKALLQEHLTFKKNVLMEAARKIAKNGELASEHRKINVESTRPKVLSK